MMMLQLYFKSFQYADYTMHESTFGDFLCEDESNRIYKRK